MSFELQTEQSKLLLGEPDDKLWGIFEKDSKTYFGWFRWLYFQCYTNYIEIPSDTLITDAQLESFAQTLQNNHNDFYAMQAHAFRFGPYTLQNTNQLVKCTAGNLKREHLAGSLRIDFPGAFFTVQLTEIKDKLVGASNIKKDKPKGKRGRKPKQVLPATPPTPATEEMPVKAKRGRKPGKKNK
jgi:hypothetical protein